jgi:nucleoid DNA-binding protein
MTPVTNEKKIVGEVLNDFPHLRAHEKDIVEIVRRSFTLMASVVYRNGKVLVKNFGTFSLRHRTIRRNYNSGVKAVVEKEPLPMMDFTQSPNIFTQDWEKEEEAENA